MAYFPLFFATYCSAILTFSDAAGRGHGSLRAGQKTKVSASKDRSISEFVSESRYQDRDLQMDRGSCGEPCPIGERACSGMCSSCVMDPSDGFRKCQDPSDIQKNTACPANLQCGWDVDGDDFCINSGCAGGCIDNVCREKKSVHQTVCPANLQCGTNGNNNAYCESFGCGQCLNNKCQQKVQQPSVNLGQPIVNVAVNKVATQSSTCYDGVASRAVDGNTDSNFFSGSVSHTCGGSPKPEWWMVDLGSDYFIQSVKLYNRNEEQERLADFYVEVLNADNEKVQSIHQVASVKDSRTFTLGRGVTGRFVRVQLKAANGVLSLAEVKVMGHAVSSTGAKNTSPTPTPSSSEDHLFQTVCPINYLECGSNGLGHTFCLQFGCGGGCVDNKCQDQSATEAPQSIINVALRKVATQSSTCFSGNAGRAVDGDTTAIFDAGSVSHTCNGKEEAEWWMVDLGNEYNIDSVRLYNRATFQERLSNFTVEVLNDSNEEVQSHLQIDGIGDVRVFGFQGVKGRFVRVHMKENNRELSLAEVEVMGH